jgi:Protein of unknown function (DUF3106)
MTSALQSLRAVPWLAAAALSVVLTAAASAPEQGPAWAALTPTQQQALAPLQRDWSSIPVEPKRKWLEVAGRLPNMSAAERARVQERMAEWSRMKPAEREAAKAAATGRKPASGPATKSSVQDTVRAPVTAGAVASLQQAKPGATTTTISTRPAPPAHHQAGLPKIVAAPGFVDRATLLPQRGPQGAAVRAASSDPTQQP